MCHFSSTQQPVWSQKAFSYNHSHIIIIFVDIGVMVYVNYYPRITLGNRPLVISGGYHIDYIVERAMLVMGETTPGQNILECIKQRSYKQAFIVVFCLWT